MLVPLHHDGDGHLDDVHAMRSFGIAELVHMVIGSTWLSEVHRRWLILVFVSAF